MPATDQNSVYVAVVIAILGFMIGFAKGGFGGLGALLTPILSLVLPVASAVGVLLPMLMIGDVFAVYMYSIETIEALTPSPTAKAGGLVRARTVIGCNKKPTKHNKIITGITLILFDNAFLLGPRHAQPWSR
jgi:hypothetical protein